MILGAHVSIAKGYPAAGRQIVEEYGCNAMQVFLKSPRSRASKPLSDAEALEFKKYATQNGLKYFIGHASYFINLAKELTEKEKYQIESILSDMEKVNRLGGKGLVVHVGKTLKLPYEKALKYLVKNLKTLLAKARKYNVKILLENLAGQKSEMGYTIEQLAELYKALNKDKQIGFCFDTCHAFVSGYDFSKKKVVEETFKRFDKLIGLKNLQCIHLNDSKKPFKSNVDRHANILDGYIGKEGLQAVIKFAHKNGIPMILETPEKKGATRVDDIKKVRKLL
jgi:deoxyribonuclease IV